MNLQKRLRSSSRLIIKNLSKSYKDSNLKVLHNISLTVGEKEVVGVIGPSGCGKSTLLDCIAGLTVPENGDILIDNKSIVKKRGQVAYMFQDDVMFPWRSVLDNVIIPLELKNIKKDTARKEAKTLLKTFGLEKFASFYPFMLSGGMRERASLLRTYLCKKDVMLLDEPFSKLDALTRSQIQEWFLHILSQQQKSVLFVTHDVDEAIYLSDRIYVLSQRPSKVIAEVPITIKKPRSIDISLSKEFISKKKQILDLLKQ